MLLKYVFPFREVVKKELHIHTTGKFFIGIYYSRVHNNVYICADKNPIHYKFLVPQEGFIKGIIFEPPEYKCGTTFINFQITTPSEVENSGY